MGASKLAIYPTTYELRLVEVGYYRYFLDKIGKSKVIVISSQLGIPIGVYQGNSVYVEIPEDLPKMTLLNIDGKALYISRATYEIFDAELLTASN
jgi:hypothetical protein